MFNITNDSFFKKRFYLFSERGRGEGEKHQCVVVSRMPPIGDLACPTTQACALTGNQTRDPLVHRLMLNPLSHTSQGIMITIFFLILLTSLHEAGSNQRFSLKFRIIELCTSEYMWTEGSKRCFARGTFPLGSIPTPFFLPISASSLFSPKLWGSPGDLQAGEQWAVAASPGLTPKPVYKAPFSLTFQ